MRAASLGPTPGSVVSCSAEVVLMLTLPVGAGLAAATASPVVRLRTNAIARAVATMRFNIESPFPIQVFPGIGGGSHEVAGPRLASRAGPPRSRSSGTGPVSPSEPAPARRTRRPPRQWRCHGRPERTLGRKGMDPQRLNERAGGSGAGRWRRQTTSGLDTDTPARAGSTHEGGG